MLKSLLYLLKIIVERTIDIGIFEDFSIFLASANGVEVSFNPFSRASIFVQCQNVILFNKLKAL